MRATVSTIAHAMRRARGARWLPALALATALHAAAVVPWLLTAPTDDQALQPDAPLALELASLQQAAPAAPPHQQPLAAQPQQAAPPRPVAQKVAQVDRTLVPPDSAVEPLPQPPQAAATPPQSHAVEAAPPPSTRPEAAERQSAPVLGRTDQPVPSPEQTWESQVLAQLERVKRYPPAARWQRQQDTVYLRLQIARDGAIKAASVLRSQGFQALDTEVIEMTRRTGTLPPPPADLPGVTVALTIPVDFYIARN